MNVLVESVRQQLGDFTPRLAVVLGSGLGAAVQQLKNPIELPYASLTPQALPMIPGHAGRLVAGRWGDTDLLVFQGRHHLYQGLKPSEIVWQVQLAADLGATELLLTNAAGGVNPEFSAGDFMWITDHLNLTGSNPLCGLQPPPFLDVSSLYRCDMLQALRETLGWSDRRLHDGVLCGLVGPNYETPAEVRMIRYLGADAVSMSTVNEALFAHHLGLRVAAVSLITNPAAGLETNPLSHEDVLSQARQADAAFAELLTAYTRLL